MKTHQQMYQEKREERLQYAKEYRKLRKQEVTAYAREYREKNRDLINQKQRARRAAEKRRKDMHEVHTVVKELSTEVEVTLQIGEIAILHSLLTNLMDNHMTKVGLDPFDESAAAEVADDDPRYIAVAEGILQELNVGGPSVETTDEAQAVLNRIVTLVETLTGPLVDGAKSIGYSGGLVN